MWFDILFCFILCRRCLLWAFLPTTSSLHSYGIRSSSLGNSFIEIPLLTLSYRKRKLWMNILESEHCIIWDLKYIRPKEPYFWACSWKGLRRQNESYIWSKLKKNCPKFSLTATFLKLEKVKNVIVQQVSS